MPDHNATTTRPRSPIAGRARTDRDALGYRAAMTNPNDVETVERVIPAPADKIFDLLADPRHHPEIDGSGAGGT